MIDVIYHGDATYRDATRINHAGMIDVLRQNWPVALYWHDEIEHDQQCEFDRHGPREIWRFYQRILGTSNPIFIYLSTQTWFGPGAIEAVLAEVNNVVNKQNDVAFLGANFRHAYSETHARHSVDKHRRLGEQIVIARRDRINTEPSVMQYLRDNKKFKDTSRSWPSIIQDTDRAITVECQIYLVRRLDHELTDWRVGWDYLRTVDHSDEALTWWVMSRPTPL